MRTSSQGRNTKRSRGPASSIENQFTSKYQNQLMSQEAEEGTPPMGDFAPFKAKMEAEGLGPAPIAAFNAVYTALVGGSRSDRATHETVSRRR